MWSVDPETLAPIPGAPMWSSPTALMWADELFTAMQYIGRITTAESLAGLRLTLQTDITGDQINLFYREADLADMWSADDSTLMWTSAAAGMWSVGEWQPWLGFVEIKPLGAYDIRVDIGGGQLQGRIDQFKGVVDVADIYQTSDNVAISSGGTRIPLVKNFTVLKVVNLTLQDNGSDAVTARVIDKDPINGPLVKCYDLTDTAVSGSVDAILQGY